MMTDSKAAEAIDYKSQTAHSTGSADSKDTTQSLDGYDLEIITYSWQAGKKTDSKSGSDSQLSKADKNLEKVFTYCNCVIILAISHSKARILVPFWLS